MKIIKVLLSSLFFFLITANPIRSQFEFQHNLAPNSQSANLSILRLKEVVLKLLANIPVPIEDRLIPPFTIIAGADRGYISLGRTESQDTRFEKNKRKREISLRSRKIKKGMKLKITPKFEEDLVIYVTEISDPIKKKPLSLKFYFDHNMKNHFFKTSSRGRFTTPLNDDQEEIIAARHWIKHCVDKLLKQEQPDSEKMIFGPSFEIRAPFTAYTLGTITNEDEALRPFFGRKLVLFFNSKTFTPGMNLELRPFMDAEGLCIAAYFLVKVGTSTDALFLDYFEFNRKKKNLFTRSSLIGRNRLAINKLITAVKKMLEQEPVSFRDQLIFPFSVKVTSETGRLFLGSLSQVYDDDQKIYLTAPKCLKKNMNIRIFSRFEADQLELILFEENTKGLKRLPLHIQFDRNQPGFFKCETRLPKEIFIDLIAKFDREETLGESPFTLRPFTVTVNSDGILKLGAINNSKLWQDQVFLEHRQFLKEGETYEVYPYYDGISFKLKLIGKDYLSETPKKIEARYNRNEHGMFYCYAMSLKNEAKEEEEEVTDPNLKKLAQLIWKLEKDQPVSENDFEIEPIILAFQKDSPHIKLGTLPNGDPQKREDQIFLLSSAFSESMILKATICRDDIGFFLRLHEMDSDGNQLRKLPYIARFDPRMLGFFSVESGFGVDIRPQSLLEQSI